MKTEQKMTYLRKENLNGISKRTGKEYNINYLYFLDEDLAEVKLGVHKDCQSDLDTLQQLKQYKVLINIQLGNYTNIDVLSFKPI